MRLPAPSPYQQQAGTPAVLPAGCYQRRPPLDKPCGGSGQESSRERSEPRAGTVCRGRVAAGGMKAGDGVAADVDVQAVLAGGEASGRTPAWTASREVRCTHLRLLVLRRAAPLGVQAFERNPTLAGGTDPL